MYYYAVLVLFSPILELFVLVLLDAATWTKLNKNEHYLTFLINISHIYTHMRKKTKRKTEKTPINGTKWLTLNSWCSIKKECIWMTHFKRIIINIYRYDDIKAWEMTIFTCNSAVDIWVTAAGSLTADGITVDWVVGCITAGPLFCEFVVCCSNGW